MSPIILNCEQGSAEWEAARLGPDNGPATCEACETEYQAEGGVPPLPEGHAMSFPVRLIASVLAQIAAFCVLLYFSDAPPGVTLACVAVIVYSARFASAA